MRRGEENYLLFKQWLWLVFHHIKECEAHAPRFLRPSPPVQMHWLFERQFSRNSILRLLFIRSLLEPFPIQPTFLGGDAFRAGKRQTLQNFFGNAGVAAVDKRSTDEGFVRTMSTVRLLPD